MLNNNDIELLQTTQSFFLPIYNYAVMLENQYGNLLNPPVIGIYKVGEMYPCIVPNKIYYSQKVNKNNTVTNKPIVDFNVVNDTVVDEIGNVIIHSGMMRNKEQYLKNEPTVPVKGLLLIELLIKRHIESICQWSRHSTYNSKIVSHLKQEGIEIFNEGYLDNICESLYMQINDFIGKDDWHIYFVKFVGLDLLIEKSVDYRVHEYHKRINNGEWLD